MLTKIETLEREVRALSREELAEFRAWFSRFDASRWDRQIESDVKAGKLDRLAAEALAAHQRGESREL